MIRRVHPSGWGFFGGLGLGFLIALFALGDFARLISLLPDAFAQSAAAQAVRIMDGAHVQLAGVNHAGRLLVDTGSTSGVTDHITSVTHIQVSGSGTATQSLSVRCVNTGGTAFEACGGAGGSGDAVNVFHQSTIRHISSVTHVAGAMSLISQSGTYVTVTGTQLDVNCTGCAAASVVAVSHISAAVHIGGTITGAQFHVQGLGTPGASHGGVLTIQGITGMNAVTVAQSTARWNVDHVTSVLHISAAGTPWAVNMALAVRCVNTGATAFEACGGAGSGDAVNVFHQSTIRHVSGSLHVAGTITGAAFHVQGLGTPGQSHAGVLTIQGITGMNAVVVSQSTARWNVDHITSVLHIQVAGAGIPGASLSVRCVNTGGTAFADCGGAGGSGDAVNVFHQSTIRHISSVTHIAGAISLVNQAGTYATLTGNSLDVNLTTATVAVTQSGTWTVQPGNTPNTTAWLTNVAHISAVTHIAVANHAVLRVMGAHVTGSLHVAGVTNVGSGAPGTGTTQMVCHSTLAIHVAATAPGYTQIIHLTSSNGGINQAQWRIYICSILIVSAHAQGFSLLEGVGTTCQGQVRHALIGAWRPDDSVVLAANGGFSVASPFPTLATQVPGNNLCIGQTTRTAGGSISGFISYRAGP